MKPTGGAVRIEALDGLPLGATHFPAARPGGVALIINGAMAVPQSYYAFARTASAAGFDTVTYDYRGIGRSRPPRHEQSLRGMAARARDWMQLDFEGVHRWARRELECPRVVVVGHSFGGNAFGLAPSVRHHGLVRIGHFGLFRPAAQSLWPLALDWLARHTRSGRPALAQPAGAYA